MIELAAFDVYGTPKPQGSKTAFVANGHARMKESGGASFAAWRNAVAQRAHEVAETLERPLDGPLRLTITFRFAMPPSTVKKENRLAGWRWKTTEPDTDKLVRAVGDACQAGALVSNDSRFVDVRARKIEVLDTWTGAHVVITAADADHETITEPARQGALL